MIDLAVLTHGSAALLHGASTLIPHAPSLPHSGSTTSTTVETVQSAERAASSGSGSIFTPIAKPLAWVLAGIYSVIPNFGVAIIGLSILWMLIISPLTLKSTRSMLAMQKLQPELKKLQAKHRDDKQAFAQAQMDLFREHNVSPFGSCLPMLLPLPVFFSLFRVIDGLSHTSTINKVVYYTPKYLNQGTKMYKAIQHSHGKLEAFGMNLAQGALAHHSGVLSAAPYWIALLAMAGTSYVQSAMMMNRNQSAAAANPQMKMMKYFAPVFALICIKFPAGVIVYYATSNICRILQQDAMYRYDPKVKALVAQEVEEVEELTHEIDERAKNRPGYTPPRGAKPPREATPPRSTPPRSASSKGGDSGGGRSRFRDLLAAAAEQQQAQRNTKGGDAKAGDDDDDTGKDRTKETGSGTNRTNGNGSAGRDRTNGSGNNRTNGSGNGTAGKDRANGSNGRNGNGSAGPNRNRPAGNRTNRKRRGR